MDVNWLLGDNVVLPVGDAVASLVASIIGIISTANCACRELWFIAYYVISGDTQKSEGASNDWILMLVGNIYIYIDINMYIYIYI